MEYSVCFNCPFIQNDILLCAHPLCEFCYSKLITKCCPICRSIKRYENLRLVFGENKIFYVPINRLTKFALNSYDYTRFMNSFLKSRTKGEIFKKANRLLKYNKFILENNKCTLLADFNNNALLDYTINKRFSKLNASIIKSELIRRMKI